MRRLRVKFRGYTVTADAVAFASSGQAATLTLGGATIDGSFTLAQSNLDATTWSSYSAAITATERAAIVVDRIGYVSGTPQTVTVEIRDGSGNLRATGTMAVPWATSSGSTITIGEVNASGITVSSGGVPDAHWYCQFRGANGRFVRGTFGVAGSGRDFVWSLSSFQTGSRGTLGTVTLTATGTSSLAVAQIEAPFIYVYPQDNGLTTTNLGLTPRPESITATPAVGSTLVCHFGNYTRDLLDPVSALNYNYPLIRSYQWYRNGVAIPGQNTQCYTAVAADAGQSITCKETVYEPRGSVAAQYSAFPLPPDATYTFTTSAVVPTGSRSSTLVYQDNFEYLGSFLPPNHSDLTFYSGYGLAWNPDGDGGNGSLFMLSKDGATGKTVEFSIPTIAPRATIGDCPYATILQGPTDAREGWTAPVAALGDTIMAGQLVYNGRLIQTIATAYSFAAQPRSHASRPLNLATTGDVKWAKVVDTSRGLTSGRTFGGAMCHVPPAWQTALGGPVLTGMTSLSVVSNGSSDGPCSAAFDPDEINDNTVEAETLTRYTGGQFNNDGSDLVNSAGGYFGQPHPVWFQGQMNYSEHAMFIPFGTDSLLFIGQRAEGSYQYGPGDSFHNGGTPGGDPVTVRGVSGTYMRIYDPLNPYTPGPHGYPYSTGVYAFRLSDLAAVKAGTKAPGEVRPYGMWGIEFPFTGQNATRVRSSAYDAAGRRLFVSQWVNGQIAIHVYRINNATVAGPDLTTAPSISEWT